MSRVVEMAIGAVFLAAGALKILQPVHTTLVVGAYDLLPPPLAVVAGLVLPGLEVAVGAALVAGFLREGATFLAACLSFAFFVFVASAWARGLDVTCGCFGPLDATARAGWPGVLFDLLLLSACLFVWRRAAA